MKNISFFWIGFFCFFVTFSSVAQEEDLDKGNLRVVSTENNSRDNMEETLVIGRSRAGYTEITENTEKLLKMPGSLGDPIGAITALPGVFIPSSGGAPVVRGSSPEDNRYYIDGMPAGYIFHEFNTSIFDENVVQDFQLYPAGFGAQYSEAIGAVFDIRLRNPVNQDFKTKLSASLLRTSAFFEGGVTENSAFYLSLRYGLIHLFVPEDDEPDDDGLRIVTAPKDSDYQFKYHWDVDKNNSVSLTMAGATDFAEADFTELSDQAQKNPDFQGQASIDRNFNSQGINWLYTGGSGQEVNLTLANYGDSEEIEWGDNYFLQLELDNILGRLRYSVPLHDSYTLSIGGEFNNKSYNYAARLVLFTCSEFSVDCQVGRRDPVQDDRELSFVESSVFLINSWRVTNRFFVETGIQYSGNDYTNEYFTNPKLSLSWTFNPAFEVFGSAGQYNRTPDIETILPVVGNPQLKSPRSDHFTFGLKGDLGSSWNWSIESYIKTFSELPLALDENEPDGEQLYSNDIEGEVRGVDILINKDIVDRWYGWMALSLSESERTNLRTNATQTYTFDTPVIFNLVGNYKITSNWNTGLRYTYKSGEATTEIVGIRPNDDFPGQYLPEYGEPFQDRLPNFSRLDFRAERNFLFYNKDASFFIDILNLLNTTNVSERLLNYERVNETSELHIRESEDLGIFGSVGFSLQL